MLSTECSSPVVWVAEDPQPSEWTNFPHATLCVWLNERMAKSVGRHDDINNQMQDCRKVKEESRETMAVEVVTGCI